MCLLRLPVHSLMIALLRSFFRRCHSVAPFLGPAFSCSVQDIRSRIELLLLAILLTAARYATFTPIPSADQPSRLHPSHRAVLKLAGHQLVHLHLVTKPATSDRLGTDHTLPILEHWGPLDWAASGSRSRPSESSSWSLMGLATRWATHINLKRRALQSFLDPPIQRRPPITCGHSYMGLPRQERLLVSSACACFASRRASTDGARLRGLTITPPQPTSIGPRPTPAGLDGFLSYPRARRIYYRLGTLLTIACPTRRASDDPTDRSFTAVTPDSVQAFNTADTEIDR